MLTFSIRYTFHIVGKTSGNDTIREEYLEELNKVLLGVAGDDEMTRQITPRGKNFTKVKCEVEVQSVSMINSIYDELEKMERTVMRF
jgi:putative lipoic acid-binding regulatory protein